MIREGLSFYIATKEEGIVKITNLKRTDEQLDNDDCIMLDELNKSDYLYETIILLIIKKIKRQSNNDNGRLYKLIKDIESLTNKIYISEITKFDIHFSDSFLSNLEFNEENLLSKSYSLASICMEEGLFDYE